jgi:hypothetical protein
MSFDLGNEPSSVGQSDSVDVLTTSRWRGLLDGITDKHWEAAPKPLSART